MHSTGTLYMVIHEIDQRLVIEELKTKKGGKHTNDSSRRGRRNKTSTLVIGTYIRQHKKPFLSPAL